MGHRDELLEGAKRCLLERGWARTTARDVVAASNTNLGSIGYHFGSKDVLLTEALIALTDAWGGAVEAAARDAGTPGFAATWDAVLRVFPAYRGLWLATFEVLAADSAAVREHLESIQGFARTELAKLFGTPPATGAALQTLLLGAMAQRLIDPGSAPDGAQLTAALVELVDGGVARR